MQLTHFGHSCLLVGVAGQRILIDPGTFSAGFEALTGLDAVLVTHVHADHLDVDRLPALCAGNPDAVLLADPDGAERLRELGLDPRVLVEREVVMLGPVSLVPHGARHAVNHDGVPRVTNVGAVITADDEPVLFHPGDAYDTEPGAVDVLAVPLNAPWAALRDTIGFVRRIAPTSIVPIHDALLSPPGRALYLKQVAAFGVAEDSGQDLAVHDVAGRGPVRFERAATGPSQEIPRDPG